MKIGLDIRPREGKTEMWSGGPAFLESLTARGKVEASLEPAEWEYVLLSDEIGCWNKASILAAITSEGASMEVLEIVAGLFRGYVESDCPSDSIGP